MIQQQHCYMNNEWMRKAFTHWARCGKVRRNSVFSESNLQCLWTHYTHIESLVFLQKRHPEKHTAKKTKLTLGDDELVFLNKKRKKLEFSVHPFPRKGSSGEDFTVWSMSGSCSTKLQVHLFPNQRSDCSDMLIVLKKHECCRFTRSVWVALL